MPTLKHKLAQTQFPRRGFSLLEVAAAAVLVAAITAPSLSVMRDALAKSRELHRQNLLANYAVRILEDQSGLVATNWINESISGDFASDGHPSIRYAGTKSDAVIDGGIVNQLMHIQITVFDDSDDDDTLDSNELRVDYRTKVAKLNSYENEPL